MRLESWALNLSRKLHGLNFDTCWFPKLGCLLHSSPTKLDCGILALQFSHTGLWGRPAGRARILDSGQKLLTVGVVSPHPLRIRLIQGALLQAGWLSSSSSYGLGCPHGLPMPQKGELPQRSPRAMVFKPFIFISNGNSVQTAKYPKEKSKATLEEMRWCQVLPHFPRPRSLS